MTPAVADPVALPFRSVLVTGADGFVAGSLLPAIERRLAESTRLTLCARQPCRVSRPATVISADLTVAAEMQRVMAEAAPDLVIHLAALSSVAESQNAANETWRVNWLLSYLLADALAAQPQPATVLFASSAEVYGLSFRDGPADEEVPLRPQSPYARAKAAAEAVMADVLRPANRLIVVRPTNHSGPSQTTRFVLPSFARQIAEIEAGRQAPVLHVGNLDAERDIMDVRDVADAYVALLDAAANLPIRSVFNVGTGSVLGIGQLLGDLLAASRCPITVEVDPARIRPVDVPRAAVDARRIRAATGWRPRRERSALLAGVLDAQRRLVEQEIASSRGSS